ncbi:esterase, PHB depolymerase family [Methylocella silvestris BL2]|uniref:Esterase, PHB depolymerase family n=1 Tax=Methylocella silvestris (strain DSM 15510 / CIP 108128 / LMG 27833 / NCIMB 13906 / BL2) TaxID=395965 RepID=B8ES50_METSB|nr:PHB depolymerase family esterase [Methylocella silvestris]ACK52265.1 esterase, PHB depolymerase family [Methylocella silvestris BL2]
MNAFSKIDLGEVTRLTKAGKLTEAMGLLQGSKLPGTTNDEPHRTAQGQAWRAKRSWPTIDMAAPSSPGGAWTAPGYAAGPIAGASAPLGKASGFPDVSATMQAFRSRVAGQASFSSLGEGLATGGQAPLPMADGARFEERTYSNSAGSRTYKVFIPSGYAGQALPVVMMLHGCTQNPDDFAAGTRMNDLAEKETFLVVYPRQPQSANMQKCWNWFKAEDQRREGGEPSLIAGIALAVVDEFSADPTRVYVAGLSAGGAAAAIMGATYPDLFAAVGVHSGLACGAAKDMPSAFAAMNGGGVTRARGDGPAAPTIVFHGDSDRTVNLVNGDQVIAQARPQTTLATAVTRGEAQGGMAYTRTVHSNDAGQEVLEQWVLHGAGHAWSGGSASGSYTDPRGPDASREMLRFFLAQVSTKATTRH